MSFSTFNSFTSTYTKANDIIAKPPTGVTIQTTTSTSLTVSFTPPSGTITLYTATATPVTGGTSISATSSTSPITITGLTAGVNYVVRVNVTGNYIKTIATSFNPKSITGCQLWFDASDNATVISSANKVSQWNDKSDNGYSVVQPTSANQPTYTTNLLNGRPGIVLSSTSWLYQYGNNISNFSSSPATTIFMVARNDSSLPTAGWSIRNTMWFDSAGNSATFRYHLSFNYANTIGVTSIVNTNSTFNNSGLTPASF